MLVQRIKKAFVTELTSVRSVSSAPVPSKEWKVAKECSEIPGPSVTDIFINVFRQSRLQPEKRDSIIETQKRFGENYGNIVKFPKVPGRPLTVMLTDPHDIEKVFRTESRVAVRPGFDSFVHYRKNVRKDIFKGMGGLLTEHGAAWQEMRTKVNPVMMQPRTTKKYVPGIDLVAQEFCTNLRYSISQNKPPADLFPELNKWALETIGFIALDTRLNILGEESNEIIDVVQKFFELSFELDMKPSLWKYFSTPKFKQMMNVLDDFSNLIDKHIQTAIKRLETRPADTDENRELSVLEKLLKIDRHTAIVMVFDMILAGVDTTATASTSVLYYLANNPEKQKILREELFKIMPNRDTPLTESSLDKVPYLKACIKEGHRLYPVLPGIIRNLEVDMVIKGYKVPKGTLILLSTVLLGQMDEHFPRSAEFLPERWLKNAEVMGCPSAKTANPFILLPFGFGSRSCIGRRFAELEIEALIARFIRNFEIVWTGSKLRHEQRLVSVPCMPVKCDYKLIE